MHLSTPQFHTPRSLTENTDSQKQDFPILKLLQETSAPPLDLEPARPRPLDLSRPLVLPKVQIPIAASKPPPFSCISQKSLRYVSTPSIILYTCPLPSHLLALIDWLSTPLQQLFPLALSLPLRLQPNPTFTPRPRPLSIGPYAAIPPRPHPTNCPAAPPPELRCSPFFAHSHFSPIPSSGSPLRLHPNLQDPVSVAPLTRRTARLCPDGNGGGDQYL